VIPRRPEEARISGQRTAQIQTPNGLELSTPRV
jgi:hypothetical protein